MENNELQGTEQWFSDRRGKITASKFKDIVAEGKDGPYNLSVGALTYAYDLIADVISAEGEDAYECEAFEHGSTTEPIAIENYELKMFKKVERCGFIKYGERAGGSPDGLVDLDGIIEVKCPIKLKVHIKTLITNKVPSEHLPQIQGNLLVTGRKWCDFISFSENVINPKHKIVVIRVYRDEPYIDKLKKKIYDLARYIDETLVLINK